MTYRIITTINGQESRVRGYTADQALDYVRMMLLQHMDVRIEIECEQG